jgi:translation initiation factor 2 alpha subunit (eIF-2alpha)
VTGEAYRIPAPAEDLLRSLADRLHRDVDELFDLAVQLRRELQDAEAEFEAVADQGHDVDDPAMRRARFHARASAGALREIHRQMMLALCDLVPPGAERAGAYRGVEAWLRGRTPAFG